MSKLSKQVENRLTVSGKVVAAVRVHKAGIAVALAQRAEATMGAGKGPTTVAYEAIMDSMGAALEGSTADLEAAELTYTAEQADDVAPRAKRDALTNEGFNIMTRLRSSVEDALGADGLSTYGLSGATPRAPRALASHMTNVISLMAGQPKAVTTELGSTFDTAVVAAALTARRDALEAVLGDVDREARELEDALGKRNKAVEAWIEVYQGVASAFSGMCRLGGRKDLADRVRPTTRTVSGEDAGEVIEEGGDNGAGGGAAPA